MSDPRIWCWCNGRPWYAAALLAAIVLTLWPLDRAQAHADIVSSDPPDGAYLAQGPQAVTLTFSEDVDPGYTSVQLRDSEAEVILDGPGVITAGQPRVLRLALPDLPMGTYHAVWQTRSAVDGYRTTGNVSFSVGAAAVTGESLLALLPPPDAPDPATARPAGRDVLPAWLSYLAAALLIGSLAFGWLIWSPAYRAAATPPVTADAAVTTVLRRLALISLAGLTLLTLAWTLVQAAEAARAPILAALPTLERFLAGRSGQLMVVRFLGAVCLIPLVRSLPRAGSAGRRRWGLAAGLSAGLLLTFSLESHSAAYDPLGGTLVDWVHLLAMGIWLGGLLPLALALRLARRSGGPAPWLLVPRFARLALAGLAALGLSGLLAALRLVGSGEALTGTTGGQALIVKSGLFLALIAWEAVNLLVVSPRLRSDESAAARGLSRTLTAEIAISVVILLAAGVLTGVAPAREALHARQRLGPAERARIGAVSLTLRIAPGRTGINAFAVDVVDERPGSAASPAQVLLRLSSPGTPAGAQLETRSRGGERYVATASDLDRTGKWQIEVILRRAGFDDVTHDFTISIGAGLGGGPA